MSLIALPNWCTNRNIVTKAELTAEDFAVLLALSLRLHDCAEQVRSLCRRCINRVPRENQPGMKRIARESDDEKVFEAALQIVNRVCDKLKIRPDIVFVRNDRDQTPPQKPLTQQEIRDQLEILGSDVEDPSVLAQLIHEMAQHVENKHKGPLYMIAGSKNPAAMIKLALTAYDLA